MAAVSSVSKVASDELAVDVDGRPTPLVYGTLGLCLPPALAQAEPIGTNRAWLAPTLNSMKTVCQRMLYARTVRQSVVGRASVCQDGRQGRQCSQVTSARSSTVQSGHVSAIAVACQGRQCSQDVSAVRTSDSCASEPVGAHQR